MPRSCLSHVRPSSRHLCSLSADGKLGRARALTSGRALSVAAVTCAAASSSLAGDCRTNACAAERRLAKRIHYMRMHAQLFALAAALCSHVGKCIPASTLKRHARANTPHFAEAGPGAVAAGEFRRAATHRPDTVPRHHAHRVCQRVLLAQRALVLHSAGASATNNSPRACPTVAGAASICKPQDGACRPCQRCGPARAHQLCELQYLRGARRRCVHGEVCLPRIWLLHTPGAR